MQYAIIGRMIQLWGLKGAQQNDTILKAIKGESTSHTPVWFMRQAGRSQPEYRKLKEKYSLFEITHPGIVYMYITSR